MPPSLAFPRMYLLATRLADDEIQQLKDDVPSLTADAAQADLFVGNVSKIERAKLELRRLGIVTIDGRKPSATSRTTPTTPPAKRRKRSDRSPSPIVISSSSDEESRPIPAPSPTSGPGLPIRVVKVDWIRDSLARGSVLPVASYVVYEGRKIRMEPAGGDKPTSSRILYQDTVSRTEGILRRAQADRESQAKSPASPRRPYAHTDSAHHPRHGRTPSSPHAHQLPSLVRTTTAEHDEGQSLPPIPDFLHTTYSCQRPTPLHPPNEPFIQVLKAIRYARELVGDQIGIRAYSTAIATLSAYPYVLSVPAEVNRLPGCGPKIVELFREFRATGGHVREADDAAADEKLSALRIFCSIWGVADATARSFYNRGWRDLDDVIEFGWNDLAWVQKIGVKYYDELKEPLPRPQVETIAERVLAHANGIQPGYQMVIAGGYRRGKELCGDVDIILSHPDETATHLMIGRLVLALEQAGLVTYTLALSTANSDRGQAAVSWKGNALSHHLTVEAGGGGGRGGGDTLDKALVVWQDPMEEAAQDTRETGSAPDDAGDQQKTRCNTNPHRRVDIIVAPWKTVGCAVLGWSGGTTFQRDLRRYCNHERGLRFDSSGVRSRADGSWVDLENFAGNPAPDMLAAEKRVFAALGLEFRPPNERCTG